MKGSFRGGIAFLAVVGFGTAWRVLSPGRIGLWRDEVQALNIASLPSVTDIWRFLYAHESHPPLFYFLEHFVGRVTGDAATAMSVIALIASIALIPAVWWLASLSQVRGATAVAATLVAVSVPLSFFSVQLRPYSLLSLAIVVGTAAMVQDRETPSARWRALWAAMALALIYLHHVGAVVVLGQVITAMLLARPALPWRVQARSWGPFIGAVAVGAIPDIFLLAHQSAVAAYRVQHPIAVLRPLREVWGLAISFPGEVGLGMLAAIVCLFTGPRRAGPGLARQTASDRAHFAASLFLVVAGILALASYRSNLLVPYVVLSVAPLGSVAAGIVITAAMARAQRWRSVIFAEVAVTCVLLSTFAFVGNGKTDTDVVARYIAAEARRDDLIILVPGALGPSFNRVFNGAQSRIDFPIIGKVTRYEFDHDFERVASPAALRAALDSIATACRAGRRVWLVTPVRWILAEAPPIVLMPDMFGGLGQAYIARANLLERRATQAFGAPARVVRPSEDGAGVEHLEARLWGRVARIPSAASGATCDVE